MICFFDLNFETELPQAYFWESENGNPAKNSIRVVIR